MADDGPKRFGRYLILDHLVDGGMATVSRARYIGEEADKIVAIKMIRKKYSEDESFKKMFLNEIKVAFGLSHPNIAQTHDYGILGGQLYATMEYVDGKNIKQYISKLAENKQFFPINFAVYIISQVCSALFYSHRFTEKLTGKYLNIVHRDISPHNIMVSYDGSVKVIDFGIAKAEVSSDKTQAGTIKGKLSYIAPEYLEGIELDHRYDQFATSITLWEMLCGRKLFTANNDLAVLKKIQTCNIPVPSSINKDIPKELDEIILKGLSKDRNKRFESMDVMAKALNKFLYQNYNDFSASDLETFCHQIFEETIEEDRKKMVGFGQIDLSSYIKELGKEKQKGTSTNSINVLENPNAAEKILELDDLENKSASLILEGTSGTGISSRLNNASESKNSFVKSQTYKRKIGKKEGSQNTSYKLTKPIKKKSELLKTVKFIAFFAVLAILHLNRYKIMALINGKENTTVDEKVEELPLKGSAESNMVKKEVQQNAREISSIENPGEIEERFIYLKNIRASQKMYVGSKLVDFSAVFKAKVGEVLHIRIEEDQRYPVFLSYKVNDSGENYIYIPQGEFADRTGILTSRGDFIDKSFYLIWGKDKALYSFPIENLRLPIGKYRGYIYHENLDNQKDIQFTIEENKVTYLEE